MTPSLCNIPLAAVAAAACLGTAGTPAHAATGMEVALQDDGSLVAQLGMKRSRTLQLAQELHVTRIRVNVFWASVVNKPHKKTRPKHRHYNLTVYDRLFLAARKRHMKLELTLSGAAPRWATGNGKVGGYKPKATGPGSYEEFVTSVARHFKGHVDRYSIWNEPNYRTWLEPLSSGPRYYRSLYKAGWKAIKKVDPRASVLFGETAPYAQSKRATAPLEFVREVLKGGGLRADGFAHHPYDFRHSLKYRYPGADNVTMYTLSRLTSALDKWASSGQLSTPDGRSLPLYLTEYGFMGSGRYKVSPESKRADYMRTAFQWALDDPHVKQMLQYLMVRPGNAHDFFDTSIVVKKGKKVVKTETFKALASWAKKQYARRKIARNATAAAAR